jgi:hypothetical protein
MRTHPLALPGALLVGHCWYAFPTCMCRYRLTREIGSAGQVRGHRHDRGGKRVAVSLGPNLPIDGQALTILHTLEMNTRI